MFASTVPFHMFCRESLRDVGHIPESSVEERTIELERDQLGNLDLDLDVGYTRNKLCPILKNSYSSLRPLVQHRRF